jgi:hypothetical protein
MAMVMVFALVTAKVCKVHAHFSHQLIWYCNTHRYNIHIQGAAWVVMLVVIGGSRHSFRQARNEASKQAHVARQADARSVKAHT